MISWYNLWSHVASHDDVMQPRHTKHRVKGISFR